MIINLITCQYYQLRRKSNGNPCANKKLQNREKMKNCMAALLISMALVKREMAHS
jgi:hypothetical protein